MIIDILRIAALLLLSLSVGLRLQHSVGQLHSRWRILMTLAGLPVGAVLGIRALMLGTAAYETLLPMLKGSVLAAYGFVWFQNTLIERRLESKSIVTATSEVGPDEPATEPTVIIMDIVVTGIQLGLLMFALNEQAILDGALAVGVASLTATCALPRALQFVCADRNLDAFVRCFAGACLFGLGTGGLVERASEGQLPAGVVASSIAIVFVAISTTFLVHMGRSARMR